MRFSNIHSNDLILHDVGGFIFKQASCGAFIERQQGVLIRQS
ncbi:MAG: hypothetical protein RLZZ245_2991 [Verrucomicrobiota bacterium]